MAASEEQRAEILALLEEEEPLSSQEIADKVGVRKMVVAGFKAASVRARGRKNKVSPKPLPTRVTRSSKRADYIERFKHGDKTEKWAVTMAKVGIRQAVAQAPWPRWQFATFCGPHGGEAVGIVDPIAIRKDHGKPLPGLKRGDALNIVLIQVKGGHAAKPTEDDGKRLRIVKHLHRAHHVILATWVKGEAANFFLLREKPGTSAISWQKDWKAVTNLNSIFA